MAFWIWVMMLVTAVASFAPQLAETSNSTSISGHIPDHTFGRSASAVATSFPSNETIAGLSFNFTTGGSQYTHSIQLLFMIYGRAHARWWYVFGGPQGVAVNPCGDKRFREIYHANAFDFEDKNSHIYKGARWPIKIGKTKDCFIVGDPGYPGQIRCGENSLILDLAKDPQYSDPPIWCWDDRHKRRYYFERAWFVEWNF
ncbi:hypothetical protein ACN47E_004623 [Coniothyrium glycines]